VLGDVGISLLGLALAPLSKLSFNWGVTQEAIIQTLLEGAQSQWYYNSNLDPRVPFSWSGLIKTGNPEVTGVPIGDTFAPSPEGLARQNFLPQLVWNTLPVDYLSYDGSDVLVEQIGAFVMDQYEKEFYTANQLMLNEVVFLKGDDRVFGLPAGDLYPLFKALGPVLTSGPNPVNPTNAVMVEATALSEQVIDALNGFDAFISGCPECTITDTPGLTPSIQNFYSDFLNPWTSTRR